MTVASRCTSGAFTRPAVLIAKRLFGFALPLAAALAGGCGAPEDDVLGGGQAAGGSPVALAPGVASKAAAGAFSEASGRLERLIFDGATARASRTEYFLRMADGRRINLDFGNSHPPLTPGRLVRVRGTRVGDTLAVAKAATDVETLEYQGDPGVAPLGGKRYAVIMVKYEDDPNQPYTQDEMRTMVFTGSASVNAYIQENSFGKVSMMGLQRWEGDVFGWMNVPHPTCNDYESCCITATNFADTQLRQTGVNLEAYDYLTYIVPGMGRHLRRERVRGRRAGATGCRR